MLKSTKMPLLSPALPSFRTTELSPEDDATLDSTCSIRTFDPTKTLCCWQGEKPIQGGERSGGGVQAAFPERHANRLQCRRTRHAADKPGLVSGLAGNVRWCTRSPSSAPICCLAPSPYRRARHTLLLDIQTAIIFSGDVDQPCNGGFTDLDVVMAFLCPGTESIIIRLIRSNSRPQGFCTGSSCTFMLMSVKTLGSC
jgi:hypothetical protein